MTVCTIIAANYVGLARVLAASVRRHHPDERFCTLVIDGLESDRALPGLGEVVLPGDLGLPASEWLEMAAIYAVTELATAAKPALLLHLLDRDTVVTYLDPDIQVLAPLTACSEAAARSGIALTPHCLQPVPRDGREPSERALMLAGIFNLGFIAVGQRARPFLRWWHERLRRDAIIDVANGLFTDQRWIDWVPALFEHEVLRDPGLNVAYWNAHERDLRHGPGGELLAGSSPLRFVHFSGFLAQAPSELSKHAPRAPRVVLDDYPVLAELCAAYAAALSAATRDLPVDEVYRLDRLANGVVLTPVLRRLVRTAYLEEPDGGVPNPYADPDRFLGWLADPVRGTVDAPLSRWEVALWAGRADLQAAFPDLDADHAAGFRTWLDTDPWALAERPVPLRRPPGLPGPVGTASATGWSVLAYADAELGVGEAGRRMARAALQIGLPIEVVGVGGSLSRREHRHGHRLRDRPSFAHSITCANADQLARVWSQVGLDAADRRGVRVGLWFWEVDILPEAWLPALALLDQVWVASEHSRRALDRYGLCPVELVPLPVIPRLRPTGHDRAQLGLPLDRFTYLCVYDFLSVLRRKNPLDTIEAYTAAFGPDDGAALVLKSINGVHRSRELRLVRRAAAGRPDIHVIDGYRTAGEMAGLLELADCVVSLHRAEGYGLSLIDAMAVGTPVVAAGHSGNLSFMDPQTALLVPYAELEVGPGAEPYPPTARWAQPDLPAAAAALRHVFDDRAGATARAARAQEQVLREHSLEVAGSRVRALTLDLLADRLGA